MQEISFAKEPWMAKSVLLLIVAMGFAALVGCQPDSAALNSIPKPNLNPPQVLAGAAPRDYHGTTALPPTVKRTILGGPSVGAVPLPAGIPAEWVPHVAIRPWKWIVIHHSASPTGSAAAFDREHRAKGWDELGYHFVIGNGTGSGNGQVEVGTRWPKQKWGAHAKTPDNQYNDFGIGICLVGNFDNDHPTSAQMRSLYKLASYLMKTYHIASDHVLGHRETKSTDCPGHNVSLPEIRRQLAQMTGR